jgi:hypothetical protein
MTYIQVLLRVEMRVMFALFASAVAVSGILYVGALINGVTRPWDAAILGFTGTFYVIAVPAMLIYAPLRAMRLRGRVERNRPPGSKF